VYVKSGNFFEDITDHLPSYFLLVNDRKQNKFPRPMVRIFSEANMNFFRNELEQVDWTSVYNNENVNCSYDIFYF